MTKAAALPALALLAFGVLSAPCAAEAQQFGYPPNPVAWIVGPGFSGYSGTPWAPPAWAWPIPAPKHGCYVFPQHLKGAWRQVEVCE